MTSHEQRDLKISFETMEKWNMEEKRNVLSNLIIHKRPLYIGEYKQLHGKTWSCNQVKMIYDYTSLLPWNGKDMKGNIDL